MAINNLWNSPFGPMSFDQLATGVKRTESSGNYGAIGPATKKGNHALGAYQVMDYNVPNWTLAALGRPMTQQEFLNDSKAQDAVFKHQFGNYLMKYGNPQDAISSWFTGRPVAQAGNASDGYTSNGDYINRVFKNAGAPAVGGPDAFNAPAPNAPVSPQSINMGTEDNQPPLNNLGSSLANIGSIVASLDKSTTGKAVAANMGGVARNLGTQELLARKENGWKMTGFTPNKKGVVWQNANGQARIDPLDPAFAGDEQTPMEKDLAAAQANPALMPAYQHKYGLEKLEPSLSPETRRMYAMRAIKGDNTWTREIGGDKQGSVDKRAIDEEITSVARELQMDPSDIMKARTEQRYRGKVADRIAQIDVNTEMASNKIEAAATNLLETSKKYPRGDIRFLEGIKQKWDEQTNDPNLQALKTAVDAFALDYATALNPQKTSPTVDDVRNARNKILTTMNQQSLEAAVGIVQREIGSIRENARRTHEQWFGSVEPAPAEGDKKTIRDTPEAPPVKRLKYNPATGALE